MTETTKFERVVCTFMMGVLAGLIMIVLAELTGASQLPGTAQALPPETLIKTESGVIVFVIEGQEKARIDQSGLSVNGRIRSVNLADTVVDAPADSHSAPERAR